MTIQDLGYKNQILIFSLSLPPPLLKSSQEHIEIVCKQEDFLVTRQNTYSRGGSCG